MATHRHIEKICCLALAAALVLCATFVLTGGFGASAHETALGYEERLFDTARVHTIDIVMPGWDSFIEACPSEEYSACHLVIDGESYKNVAIRAKGNTSLSAVQRLGSERYSFKIEFDHYDSAKTYHGLDKLCLNNIIQDNTYMKDYLCYRMMQSIGAAAPLCSYVNITVNGEAWGLYLAVEGIEESFLARQYGHDYGALYKPDSTAAGNGKAPGGMGSDDVALRYIDDAISSYPNIFDNAKTTVTTKDKQRLIAALKALGEQEDIPSCVDVEAVLRYFVVHNFVLNEDSYTGSLLHNYYLYEKDGRLTMLPWDYNLAFGGFGSSADATSLVNTPIDSPVTGGTVPSRPMLAWILEDETYTARYHALFADWISDFFESGQFGRLMDETKALIAPYVEADPSKFCTYEEFVTGIDTLREFCLLRAESVSGQLDGLIGATQEAQEGRENFVEAGDLSVAAMGSMGLAMGGAEDRPGEMPGEMPGENFDGEMPGGRPGEGMDGEMPGEMPGGMGDMEGERPGEMGNGGQAAPGASLSTAWLLLLVTLLALAAGLAFAAFFRGKR